ncbi:hypothetical protein [Prochlorothrix hollandica]|uniref:Uncharacterized protein n=1 Tax=Prochlorothrix hollandica PCC 9006 = CALU 1027 TaxID=317619 RepID=A0A0M2PWA5_PROHO|nr:hypothetical protein [Prochlorothrix hollandica]KKJ00455.1 hypothetical protein PROH_06600 [Prochlorothrix hollandica PCC 9006 = CALU 1027]
MPRLTPHSIHLEITRMFEQGQSFFTELKVQDWLKDHNQDPADYTIVFHQEPAPPGSPHIIAVTIDLKRHDGQAVDPWLLAELNKQA